MKNSKIHHLADVKSKNVGDFTHIWQFVVVLKGAKIGDYCNICSHCFIENEVLIGNNVTVKNGVHIWDGTTIEDYVFIGPSVVFTNDDTPRSKSAFSLERILIKKGVTIGANSTIRGGITIGEYAFIGMGSVVTIDVEPFGFYYGNPARLRGYVDKKGKKK